MNEYIEISKKEHTLLMDLAKRVLDMCHKVATVNMLCDLEFVENDYSTLTAEQLITKIREFLATNPNDEASLIFLRLIATYPVSMCQRTVTPMLQKVIGFTYHYGQSVTEAQIKEGINKISMDDVAEWFQRSKATIYEYANKTESAWKEIQAQIEEEELREKAKGIALEEYVKEEKEKLKMEKNNQTVEQKGEQTPISPSERNIHQ